jgi:RimJ/RimL family protein N-acetyltransferase
MPEGDTEDSTRVRLRDVTLADADLLDAWAADPAIQGGFNDFGQTHDPTPRDVLEKGPLRNERNGVLIVERVADGVPIGTVGWHRVSYGPNAESSAWNFGIDIVPDARGQGFGSDAQRLLAAWLFDHTEANRVEASTDIENVAEQRALEKAGFTREGIARGAQFRAGSHHDLVTYARLRGDPA